MAEKVSKPGAIAVGDFFESCTFHPCLCTEVDETGRNIEGISLVDGSIQNCSVIHCGVRKLTLSEAIKWKHRGPDNAPQGFDQPWW